MGTGWSARVMWREEGQLIIYVYHQDKTRNCGHIFRSAAYFGRGVWETVSLYVKVNSAFDNDDGRVVLYFNGDKVAEATDLRFVDDPEWAAPYHSEGYIANFMFSTFFGGSNSDWSPSTTQKAWIDDIAVVPGHVVPNRTSTATSASTRMRARATPKSYDGHKLSCEDEGAIPFDDGDVDVDVVPEEEDGKTTTRTTSTTPNLLFGFGGGGAGPPQFIPRGDDQSNRVSIRLLLRYYKKPQDRISINYFKPLPILLLWVKMQ